MPFSVKAPLAAHGEFTTRALGNHRRGDRVRDSRRIRRRPGCEVLEQRALLATISGTVFDDVNANGSRDKGEAALARVPVYLDGNHNGVLDQASGPSTYQPSDTFPMPIADYSVSRPPAPTVSTIDVSGVGGIAHLSVTLNIQHTWDSDLTATLTNPSGTTITLFSQIGTNGDNFTDTTFDDLATAAIGGGSAPFSGSYQAQDRLSAFSSQDANGTWTLQVSDGSAGDRGSLLGWSMSLTPYTEPARLTDASGQYTFSNLSAGSYTVRQVLPTGYQAVSPASGAYTLDASETDSLVANFADRLMPATLQGTVYFDSNQNGIQDPNEPGQAGVTMFLDANANGVPDPGEITTVTNALGRYTFTNLAPNQIYTVRQVAPAGSLSTGTPTSVIQTGTNVNVSRQPGSQAESAVAIDPSNTNNIFVVSNTTNGTGLFASYSRDGGVTWSAPRNIATGTDGLTAGCCDASVSFDSFGNLFLTYIDSSIQNVVVAVSSDGGQSFTQITRFTSPVDQPTITTGPNSVWVVYNHLGVPTVSHASVTGKGASFVSAFSPPLALAIPRGISGNFGDIAVGPDGQVAVAYQNASSGSGSDQIYLNTSSDGSTFGPYSVVTSTNVGSFDLIPVQPTRSIDAEASLAYDRSTGPHRGRLYLVYTDSPAPGSPDTNIYLRYSDNNGSSWSAPVQVNDDATTHSQILPKLAVDPSTGAIAVTFYDARDSETNTSVAFYAAISLDGGQSFLLNRPLSAGMSTAPSDSFNFGDYSGMAFSGGTLWAAWGDNSNSTGDNGGSLDLMVNSATVESFPGFQVRLTPGRTASDLNFGNYRAVTPRFLVDDVLYPFSITGPAWEKLPNASAFRGSEHVHAQGQAASAGNTAQWNLPRPSGTYEVFVDWVASPTNASNATYLIYDGPNLLTTVQVDQTVSPSDASYGGVLWKSLGTYQTDYSGLIVVLSSEADGDVRADAAMIASPLSTNLVSKTASRSVESPARVSVDNSIRNMTVSAAVPDVLSTTLGTETLKTFPDKQPKASLVPTKAPLPPSTAPVALSTPMLSVLPSPVLLTPMPVPILTPRASPARSPMLVSRVLPRVVLSMPENSGFLKTIFSVGLAPRLLAVSPRGV